MALTLVSAAYGARGL